MRVIEGANVDLISPFPVKEISRVYNWMHCYKSMIDTDISPKTPQDFEVAFKQSLPNTQSYGVIDKNNLTSQHEAPIVGIITFEPTTPWNAYIHLASHRKAWKHRLMDEAALLAIEDVFAVAPTLLRLSGAILESNRPLRYMIQRLGWKREALFPSWALQNSLPINVIHYGLTQETWKEYLLSLQEGLDRKET